MKTMKAKVLFLMMILTLGASTVNSQDESGIPEFNPVYSCNYDPPGTVTSTSGGMIITHYGCRYMCGTGWCSEYRSYNLAGAEVGRGVAQNIDIPSEVDFCDIFNDVSGGEDN